MSRPSGAFGAYTLRTTSVDDAQRFYADLLGTPLGVGVDAPLGVVPLPERAREHGAPSHWLGIIGATQPMEATSRIVSAGGRRLGDGGPPGRPTLMMDPHGAIVAVGPTRSSTPSRVGWHQLNVTSLGSAWRTYSHAFGWHARKDGRLPEGNGAFRLFDWNGDGRPVGMIAETARAPDVHPHWLFHFEVADLDDALDLVRARGGRVAAEPMEAFGARFAVCDDPTGAALAVRETSA